MESGRALVSVRASTWAWRQAVKSTERLVLVALADMADDHGVCWPSVSTLAERCVKSTRTVQRALLTLASANLICCEPRQRADGSSTSNRYVLQLGGDILTGAPDTDVEGECHGRRAPHDTGVTPRTTSRTVIDPSPPPDAGTGEAEGGGGEIRLSFPSALTAAERRVAKVRLGKFPAPVAQQILDELNGRLARGEVRTSALAYLNGLIARAREGSFEASAELKKLRVPRLPSEGVGPEREILRPPAPDYPDVAGNPLCQWVLRIQASAEQRRDSK